MIKIPTSIPFDGFSYELVTRHATAGIFRQKSKTRTVAFEVWMLGSIFRVPKDEEFGNTAWTYRTETEAEAKLSALDISKPSNRAEIATKKE